MNLKEGSRIVIYGCGGHARSIINVLNKNRQASDILLVDTNAGRDETIMGCTVVKEYHLRENEAYIVASGNNIQRREMFDFLAKQHFQNCISVVAVSAEIGIESEIGRGTYIASSVYIGPQVMVGDNVIINTRSVIEHETVIGSHTHIAPSVTICGRTKIGSNVFCGAGSTIIDGRTICDNVIIGAGAVVVEDINVAGMYVGVPAKRIRG